MNVSDKDKQAIYQELLDDLRIPGRDEYPTPNITVEELAQNCGISKGAAYRRLEKKVNKKEYKKAAVQVGDHSCNIYWKV